eukprot:scaffold78804_cov36-Cyclotella_meneghiniana.AAC.2
MKKLTPSWCSSGRKWMFSFNDSTGEDQAIWLLALKTARKAQQLRESRANGTATGENRGAAQI